MATSSSKAATTNCCGWAVITPRCGSASPAASSMPDPTTPPAPPRRSETCPQERRLRRLGRSKELPCTLVSNPSLGHNRWSDFRRRAIMSSQQQIPDSKTPSPALPATPRRAVCTALFIVTMGSAALAQQGTALKDVFDPDLADVKPTEALSQAVKQGQQGTGSGCYPPRLKIAVVTANPDRSFAESLGNARAAAMAAYLSAAGLPQDQFEVSSSLGSVEAVLATYGELRGDKD